MLQHGTPGTAACAVIAREHVPRKRQQGDGLRRQRCRASARPAVIVATELIDSLLGPAELLEGLEVLTFGSSSATGGAVLLGGAPAGRRGDGTGTGRTLANEIYRDGLPTAIDDAQWTI